MEEEFSPIRLIGVLIVVFLCVGSGGSVFTAIKGSETSTQSWLALTAILSSIVLLGLSPILTRKI
jgi:hypothetical protein